jgi:hypothetical protein
MSDTPRGPLDLEALSEQVRCLQDLAEAQGKAIAEMFSALAAVAAALDRVALAMRAAAIPSRNGGDTAHGGAP